MQTFEIAQMNQAEFKAFAQICKILTNFDPKAIIVQDSIIYANSTLSSAILEVDLTNLLANNSCSNGINLNIIADKTKIKEMNNMKGHGDIAIEFNLFTANYSIVGPHYTVNLEPFFLQDPNELTIPDTQQLGVPQNKHNPQTLKNYIENQFNQVYIKSYENQLEQIDIKGKDAFTFTEGMQDELNNKQPDFTLRSQVALKYIGEQHSLNLLKFGNSYILKATSKVDKDTYLEVFEMLEN